MRKMGTWTVHGVGSEAEGLAKGGNSEFIVSLVTLVASLIK